jgi:putative membrane protein
MKKTIALLSTSYFILLACNNAADDSVERADSINKANADTNNIAGSPNKVSTDDKSSSFMVRAANSGMAEVQLAKMAQQKATRDGVKNFAAMLERDHTAANNQVKNFASQRNVALPATISDDKQKMINDMEKMSGNDFDKEYISMMIKSHKDGIDLFEDTRTNASDVDIKNFADKTLPTLRMHLDSAEAIKKRYW